MGLNIGVNDGLFEGKITLMVHDTDHLDLLVQQLEQVSGVVEVSRGE